MFYKSIIKPNKLLHIAILLCLLLGNLGFVNLVPPPALSTGILDNFNRANGAIGAGWSGYTGAFSIASNQLDITASGYDTYIFWNATSFGADQEAYITFSQVDAAGPEQSLLLKSQSSTSYGNGAIEVVYDANADVVQVWTYHLTNGWIQYGANIPVVFANGDQFGAHALANGTVEVYKNNTLLATRNITTWSFYASGGYIGLWLANSSNALLDNFGGGSVTGGATNTAAPATSTNAPTVTPSRTSTPTQPPTLVPSATYTATNLPTNTLTATPSRTATFTPTVTATIPTATFTPVNTNTPGLPPTATYTFTPAPTFTNTGTATLTATSTATSTATYTPTNTSTFIPTFTRTPTLTPTSPADLIFKDGFESGNLSAWTSSVTDNGSLSLSASAALTGTRGLSANINDNNSMYVQDNLPNAETRYRARFYFDPNSITMSSGNAHYLLYGYSGTTTVVTRVEFRRSSGQYQIRAALISDASTWTTTNWFTISDAPHFIEIDWRASSAAGANSGGLTLWIDGVQQSNLTGVDNDTRRIDSVRLGAVTGIDTGTRGFEYFDAFESRRTTYIGPDSTSPTSTPTVTFTASPTATPTRTNTPTFTPVFTATNIPNGTATATSIFSPTPTTTPASAVVFSMGLGGSDSVPHQIVRTNSDSLYIVVNQQSSSVIRVYRTVNPGLPMSAADFASPIQIVESSNPISVDAVYDGGTIIHVLVNLQNGQIRDYPFDTATNTFKSPSTLATDGGNAATPLYVGTSGISGMLDLTGTLHVVYWTNGNHIQHRAYTYNAPLNTLDPVVGFTQADVSGSANHPAVAVSPFDNSLTIAWVSEATNPAQILARTRASNGTWGNIEIVSAAPAWHSTDNGISIDQSPSLIIDSAGIKHLAYIQEFDSSIGDYGRIHYASNNGSGWVDTAINALTHDPVLALNSRGEIYLIGHGHPRNSIWGTTCLSMDDMCTIKKNTNGTWSAPTLFIAHTGTDSFDASPSVKWSVTGFNRPETIEFIFFRTPYDNPVLYYARLP